VRVPWVNYGLLAVNAALFLFLFSRQGDAVDLVQRHGFISADLLSANQESSRVALWRSAQHALTSIFLHGGWLQLVGNLLYLRVFGDNLEDRFGAVLYLMFFLLAGVAGVAGHYLSDSQALDPMIGAGGAIAGVLGAYIVIFPTARVVTLFPVFIFLTFIEVPAVVFLGVWCLQQLLNGYFELQVGLTGAVPWFAHLGGFVFGVSTGLLYQLTAGRHRRRQAEARSK